MRGETTKEVGGSETERERDTKKDNGEDICIYIACTVVKETQQTNRNHRKTKVQEDKQNIRTPEDTVGKNRQRCRQDEASGEK